MEQITTRLELIKENLNFAGYCMHLRVKHTEVEDFLCELRLERIIDAGAETPRLRGRPQRVIGL